MLSVLKRIVTAIWIISCILLLQSTASARDNTDHNFLVITDLHLNSSTNHLTDLSPAKKDKLNDLDSTTLNNLLTTIRSNLKSGVIPTPDFILILGDVAQHNANSTSTTEIDAEEVFKKIHDSFSPIPLFYIFGNNDSLDIHYGPFHAPAAVASMNSMYDVAVNKGDWKDGFLSTGTLCQTTGTTYPCLITEDKTLGHYSAYLQPSLRLISINSIVFSDRRQHLTEADAQKELNWIAEQLRTAQQNHESVLLATHIPPGFKVTNHALQWTADDHDKFLRLIETYKNNIIGMLAAHTHMDELKIIRTSLKHNVAAMINSPALCTYSGNSPAVKTYYYRQHGTNWELSNTKTFYISSDLQLHKLFTYNKYYCTVPSQNITNCLLNVTLSKMHTYYTAGNLKYNPTLAYPDALYIDLPEAK